MTAQQALCHIKDSLEAVRGDRVMTMPPLPALQRLVMKWGALYLPVPWSRGVKTAPENDQQLQGTPPSNFEVDRARLLELAGRLNDRRWLALHVHWTRAIETPPRHSSDETATASLMRASTLPLFGVNEPP